MTEDVHAAAVRHADVEDQELPGGLAQPFERLLAGSGLADLADRRVIRQHLAQPRPDDGVVVRDQNPCAHHWGFILLILNPLFAHPRPHCGDGDAYEARRTHPTYDQQPITYTENQPVD